MFATNKIVQDVLEQVRDEAVKNGLSVWAQDIEPRPEAVPITVAAISLADLKGLEAWVTFREAKENVGMIFVNANDSGILAHDLDDEVLVSNQNVVDMAVNFLKAQIAEIIAPQTPPVQLPPSEPSEFLTVKTEDLASILWNDGKD